MKKIILLLLCLCIAKLIHAQNWTQTLNIISGTSPNFGTKSNDPIYFYTNNIKRMTLTSTGALKLDWLMDGSYRFLQMDGDGNLTKWNSQTSDSEKVLFGDGSFRKTRFKTSGSIVFTDTLTRLGLGKTNPGSALDVFGSIQASKYISTGKGNSFGNSSDYATTKYIPSNGTLPAFLHTGRGNSGSYPDGGFTLPGLDPDINNFCQSMYASISKDIIGVMDNQDLILRKMIGTTSYGNLRMGHDGYTSFIEAIGTNPSTNIKDPLSINFCYKHNVYIFDNSRNFEKDSIQVVAVNGKLNITRNVQIGVPGNAFVSSLDNLYVFSDNSSPKNGMRVRRENDGFGMRVVKKGNFTEAFGVYYTSDGTDGNATFQIADNGKTTITTLSTDALVVANGNDNNKVNYQIKANGQAYVGPLLQTSTGAMFTVGQSSKTSLALNLTDNTTATNQNFFQVYGNAQTLIGANLQSNSSILTVGQSSKTNPAILLTDNTSIVNKDFFKVYGNAQTFIGADLQANSSMVTIGQASKYDPAFTITDNTSSTANRDYFKVYGNGYTEINMYSSTNLSSDRIMAIKDVTTPGSIRDLFVVKKDGKVYAREVEVSSVQSFPDYVFSKNYKLRSLDELENYIATNAHLPGFEKGEYYEKNGMSVNTMLIKQQEKIEELSLYIIELGKQIKELKQSK